jgi:hypothetical protein
MANFLKENLENPFVGFASPPTFFFLFFFGRQVAKIHTNKSCLAMKFCSLKVKGKKSLSR